MSDMFLEVKDEMRQQELKKFWVENRDWVIGGVLLAILSTAGMSFWRSYDFKRDMQATAAFLQAQKTADPAALATYAQTADKDHAALARLSAAATYTQRGESEKALVIYDEMAKAGGDKTLRDLARVYALMQRVSTEDTAALHRDLDSLTGEKNPWRFTAMEMKALVFAREGKTRDAADILSLISGDAMAPQDMRNRAFTLREFYLAEAQGAAPKSAPVQEKKAQ